MDEPISLRLRRGITKMFLSAIQTTSVFSAIVETRFMINILNVAGKIRTRTDAATAPSTATSFGLKRQATETFEATKINK